ncbi:MAG: hypothetical protein IKT96_03405, partial [Paludibacteraceae bacterium]|nr:hypothetical protein [Paludibacteraceae bacterium]
DSFAGANNIPIAAPAATPPIKAVTKHKPFIILNFEIHLNNTRHLLFVLIYTHINSYFIDKNITFVLGL